MKTRITLTFEKSVIEDAKAYAKAQGKSLSQIIENYLKTLPIEKKQDDLSPNVKKLSGSVKLPKNFNYKNELGNALIERFFKE